MVNFRIFTHYQLIEKSNRVQAILCSLKLFRPLEAVGVWVVLPPKHPLSPCGRRCAKHAIVWIWSILSISLMRKFYRHLMYLQNFCRMGIGFIVSIPLGCRFSLRVLPLLPFPIVFLDFGEETGFLIEPVGPSRFAP